MKLLLLYGPNCAPCASLKPKLIALTTQMGERHKAELKTAQDAAAAVAAEKATLASQIAELTVGNGFATSKFVAEELTLTPTKARIVYGAHFEFKDGKVVGYDKPAGSAERTVLVDSGGAPLGFEAALKHLVEADPERDHVVRSKLKPGADSGTTKGKTVSTDAPLTSIERIAKGLKALAKE